MNNGLSGGSSTPAFPKRGPDAGTTGKVRPQCGSWHRTTHNVDWPALSSSDPIRWRPRADPEQKHDPGERTLASGNMGLTNQGPLQKPALSGAKCGSSVPDVASLDPGYAVFRVGDAGSVPRVDRRRLLEEA